MQVRILGPFQLEDGGRQITVGGVRQRAVLRHDPVLSPGSAAGGTPLARRPVTVLCVALQLAPSSGVALDPEAHGAVHEHVVSALIAVLERHGGKLAASDSEHLMGVFGVATVHEDDALRAARAFEVSPLRRIPAVSGIRWLAPMLISRAQSSDRQAGAAVAVSGLSALDVHCRIMQHRARQNLSRLAGTGTKGG